MTSPPNRRAKRMDDGLMSDGWLRIRESTQDVFVTSGMVKRLATASARKALRIVEPSLLWSGVMLGFAAGDFEFAILVINSELLNV